MKKAMYVLLHIFYIALGKAGKKKSFYDKTTNTLTITGGSKWCPWTFENLPDLRKGTDESIYTPYSLQIGAGGRRINTVD